MAEQKRQADERIECDQDVRHKPQVDEAADPQDHEPQHHDRAEHSTDARRAAPLHDEQADQHRQRERHDVRLELRRGDLETFDRAQHRDRRRDDAVAVEERRTEDAGQQQPVP